MVLTIEEIDDVVNKIDVALKTLSDGKPLDNIQALETALSEMRGDTVKELSKHAAEIQESLKKMQSLQQTLAGTARTAVQHDQMLQQGSSTHREH